jgi:L-ascorbate metabolism protein UlaG (beta-lactamase superfamily)
MRSQLLLGLLVCVSVAMSGQAGLDPPLESGEARIWYLGHAGWLVRTSEHWLIFDYTGPIENGALTSGEVSPEVLSGQPVVLFVSHAHGDHYAPRVLGLRESVEQLVVVMGWDEPDAGAVVVPEDGEWTEVLGARVFTLHHDYDGIPEGFFLVRSGGLTLYHSGDHGTWSEPPKTAFTERIDRMAAASEGIDVAFISAFGRRPGAGALNPGDTYTIKTLAPRVTFPMHRGGREDQYDAFAKEAASLELSTRVGGADAPGACFHYKDGKIRRR